MVCLPESLIFILAKPVRSSRAAKDTFKSVFHDEIKRWQTKYVARTKRACALSEFKEQKNMLEEGKSFDELLLGFFVKNTMY